VSERSNPASKPFANGSATSTFSPFTPIYPTRSKVVVATNVAETSVTIADIVYVIDSGKVKETQFDADTNMSRLVETYTR